MHGWCSGSHMRSHDKYKAHVMCQFHTCTCMYTHTCECVCASLKPHPLVPSPQWYPAILQEVLERLTKVQNDTEIRLFCEVVVLSTLHILSGKNTQLSTNLVSEWVVWSVHVVHACTCTRQECTHVHASVHIHTHA